MNDPESIPLPAVTYDTWLILETLARLERTLMATQDQIDALAQRLTDATSDIRADIADLKAAHPELDLSALEGKVDQLEGLALENPPASRRSREPVTVGRCSKFVVAVIGALAVVRAELPADAPPWLIGAAAAGQQPRRVYGIRNDPPARHGPTERFGRQPGVGGYTEPPADSPPLAGP